MRYIKRNLHQDRLKAIKEKYPFTYKKCEYCGEEFKREKMFVVMRWGVNQTVHSWWYCKNCMNTREAVVNEVDSDECYFGIAFIDDFKKFKKKDTTRLNVVKEKMFRELSRQVHIE